ncbi:hypothetical protein KKB55_12720, partial [Myxococcota bacterium]|nr:hypothetical protein [Myxococcota bacterium]MBU1898603.1 hypothetical protein [Myxococcota bacterium]
MRSPLLIILYAALILPLGALAQTGHLQVEQLELEPGPALLNTPLPEVTPPGGWTLDLWLHRAHEPLVLAPRRADDPRLAETGFPDRLRAELVGAFGLRRGLQIGAALPMALFLDAGGYWVNARETRPLEGAVLGDARLHARAGLLELLGEGPWRGLDLTLTAALWLPTGDEQAFEGEGAWRVEPGLGLGWRGPVRLAAHVGYHARPNQRVFDLTHDDVIRWRAAAEVPIPLDLSIIGGVFGARPTADVSGPAEALMALEWRHGGLVLTLGGGAGISEGVGAPAWRGLLRLGWRAPPPAPLPTWWAAADADLDGVADDVDVCPYEPEDRDGVRDEDGCP